MSDMPPMIGEPEPTESADPTIAHIFNEVDMALYHLDIHCDPKQICRTKMTHDLSRNSVTIYGSCLVAAIKRAYRALQ